MANWRLMPSAIANWRLVPSAIGQQIGVTEDLSAVLLPFTSWNQIVPWLHQRDELRGPRRIAVNRPTE
jgi:hypothetical protein